MNLQNVLLKDVQDLLFFREKYLDRVTDFANIHSVQDNLKAITDSEQFFITSAVEWALKHPENENDIVLTAEKIFTRRFICKREYPVRSLFKEYIKALKLDSASNIYDQPRDYWKIRDFSDYVNTLLGIIIILNTNKSILMSILITYIFF